MSEATVMDPQGELFNFAEHLLALNRGHSERLAYVDDHGTLSYGALAQRVRAVAGALQGQDVRREERVFVLMHDSSDWPCIFLGAMYAGCVPVAANTLLPAPEYAYMLAKSRAQVALVSQALLPVLLQAMALAPHSLRQVVVVHADQSLQSLPAGCVALADWLAAHPPASHCAATHPNDPGFWLFSSGSTGRPKATVHTQANPFWTAKLYGQGVLGLGPQDVCFSAAKLFFAYGLGNALSFPLSVGATTVLLAERPTPQAVFARLQGAAAGVKPTAFFGAPTLFAAMLATPDLPAASALALRLVSSAGEALPADVGQRFLAHFGVDIVDGIGSTEMLHIYLSNRPGQVRYGTTGWPVPGYDIALRDEAGQPVADGQTGDLFIRGPSAALLYWGDRAKSEETFQGAWTRSGDKYVRNTDGSYTYSGRSDDMLKVSGMYVSPFEVESTLIAHPAVLEAAVIGVPDEHGLTKTKAYVVCKAGQEVSADELKAFVKDRLAPYKYPRQIEFIAELPKTATGKIQRFRLRALSAGHA